MLSLNLNLVQLIFLFITINLVYSFPFDVKHDPKREKRDLNAIQETIKKTFNVSILTGTFIFLI